MDNSSGGGCVLKFDKSRFVIVSKVLAAVVVVDNSAFLFF
jgi:hypothetical protein